MDIEKDSFWNHVEIKTAYIHRAHILYYIEIVYLKCQEVHSFFQYQCAVWSNKRCWQITHVNKHTCILCQTPGWHLDHGFYLFSMKAAKQEGFPLKWISVIFWLAENRQWTASHSWGQLCTGWENVSLPNAIRGEQSRRDWNKED